MHKTSKMMEKPLTEIEALGLASQYDLANGHASHELTPSQELIIRQLPALWAMSEKQTSRETELIYRDAFQQLAKTPSLQGHDYFKICPTASTSIDIVAAWLAEHKLKAALIEPTFDNLYLLLKRRRVELVSLPEHSLHDGDYKSIYKNIDVIFLVNPNNPSGKVISRELFTEIIEWCASNQKIIVIDQSFRFFTAQTFDIYQLLLDANITFISFEDTGKVWPLQEIKASLLCTSKNIFHEIDMIYDEIFLCHSNFALTMLTAFLNDANERGLDAAVWKTVAARRQYFRNTLDGELLSIHPESIESTLSVEWVKVGGLFSDDITCAEYFRKNNMILLPGRQFFWAHQGKEVITQFVRFALLKPERVFTSALHQLDMELKKLRSQR